MKIIIIGGGIVGLWISLLAAQKKFLVTLIETNTNVGDFSSTRNSGVLHAGIYYKNNSNKAFHCVRGRELTVNFLFQYNVPHLICGKFIAAINSNDNLQFSEEKLIALKQNAECNGVKNIEIIRLNRNDYPFLKSSWVLHSKDTGIVDLKSYVLTLQKALLDDQVNIITNTTCVDWQDNKVIVQDNKTHRIKKLKADYIINAGGLYADEIANYFELKDYEIRPNKGIFFQLRKPLPIRKLIYPLPASDSTHLGVHYTFDMAGNAYVGPNTQWAINKNDYDTETDKAEFYHSLSRIISGYQEDDLIPCGRVGLRARLFKNNSFCDDFLIQEYPSRVIHFLGIESPGLTSAPSLAQEAINRIINT